MKKLLIASATLALTAGTAMADFNISGYGRFGLNYYDYDGNPENTTQFEGRMRVNLDASKETDSGAKFGGRIRLQWDQGSTGAKLSPAMMYVSYGGLRVEVGNAATAYDSAALLYAPEIGFQSRSYGDPSGAYYAFNSGPYSALDNNRVGIYVAYSMGDFNAKVSYVDPDQTDTVAYPAIPNTDVGVGEWGISADYTFGGLIVSGGYVANGKGIKRNDNWFLGAAYSMDGGFDVGINYIDNGDLGGPNYTSVNGQTVVIYGSKTFDAINVKAYVANNNDDRNDHDTSYGIGAGYDIGGATISGAIEGGYMKGEVRGDLGVKFDF